MADRKQTPDILANLLNGETAAGVTQVASTASASPASPRPRPGASKPRPKTATSPPAKKPEAVSAAWEHQTASFQEHNGWRLRYVDGKPSADWPGGPKLHEYIAQMQVAGWQVAAACHGAAMFGNLDKYQVIFKRPI